MWPFSSSASYQRPRWVAKKSQHNRKCKIGSKKKRFLFLNFVRLLALIVFILTFKLIARLPDLSELVAEVSESCESSVKGILQFQMEYIKGKDVVDPAPRLRKYQKNEAKRKPKITELWQISSEADNEPIEAGGTLEALHGSKQPQEHEKQSGKEPSDHEKTISKQTHLPATQRSRAVESSRDGDGTAKSAIRVESGRAAAKSKLETTEYIGSRLQDGTTLLRGQNITRLSYSLYKVIRLFRVKSMIDYPCGSHSDWMSDMLARVEYDVPVFRYIGMDDNVTELEKAKEAGRAIGNAEFEAKDILSGVSEGMDMLFYWPELDGGMRDPRSTSYAQHVIEVMKAAKQRRTNYIILGQYPRLRGVAPVYRNGKWRFFGNLKEEPFLFNDELRGVVPLVTGGSGFSLYLTVYSLRSFNLDIF